MSSSHVIIIVSGAGAPGKLGHRPKTLSQLTHSWAGGTSYYELIAKDENENTFQVYYTNTGLAFIALCAGYVISQSFTVANLRVF